jgi:hypothetical protein
MQGMLCICVSMHVCMYALLSWYICNIINDYSFQCLNSVPHHLNSPSPEANRPDN